MKQVLLFLVIPFFTLAQNKNLKSFETQPSFIENHGQFDNRNWSSDKIIYGIDYDDAYVFLSKTGITYRFDKIIRNPNRDKSHPDSPKRTNISELVNIKWLGANPNAEIIASDEVSGYYSYVIRNFEENSVRNQNFIKGFKKILYRNIYNNIDLVYSLDSAIGFKYSFILHPGANPNNIKLKYSSRTTSLGMEKVEFTLNNEGNLVINTYEQTINELAPVCFYQEDGSIVESSYRFENNVLSFNISPYNNTKSLIIDPWVVSSTFTTSTAVWEVETDGSGNVYTIGGETPMELRKYNSAGTWQWTYVTPWDTASVWLGTLATNAGGDSFITSGTTPEIERVNTAGGMVWHNNTTTGGLNTEYWTITFNCDKTKLIVGGTGGNLMDFSANIYDMDITNGNVLNTQQVHTGMGSGGFMSTPIEVRSISSSKDAKYIFLTHIDVGAVMDNFGACPDEELVFKVPNGHELGYKCENYLPSTQNGGGLKALIANDQDIYTNAGDEIFKRNLSDGSLITSVSLPGGNASTVPLTTGIVVENSGMAVDDCGNVYAGSGDRVVKFDADLNILDQSIVGFTVYDVSVNSNGEVLAVGAQQDNQATNRSGKIASVALSACDQFELVCCDVNICPLDPVCDDDPAFNIPVSSPGGTFSGSGITNTSAGTFDPSVVGPGTYVITYSKLCGSETVTIIVDPCEPIEVCYDGTNLIATGGSGTIVWSDWESFSYPITSEAECIDCPTADPEYMPFVGIYTGCSESTCTGSDFIQYATGSTASAPLNWPLQISDDMGIAFTYNNLSEIPTCTACPTISISFTSSQPSCNGAADGAASASASGGTAPYTYSWSNGSTGGTLSGLSAGTYNVTATDASGCTGSSSIILTENTSLSATISSSSNPTCYGDCDGLASVSVTGGAGSNTYLWNDPANQTTATASNLCDGTYDVTVTDANGCTAGAQIILTEPTPFAVDITGALSFCTGNSTVLDAGAGMSGYLWSNAETSQTITVTSGGNYSVTVSNASGCTASDAVTVTEAANLTPEITGILSICSGTPTTLDAGSGYSTYTWSPSGSSQTISVSTGGTYSVTVTDASGCSGFDSAIVTENANPTPEITGVTIICPGSSTTLDAGGAYSSYSWSNSGTNQTTTINAIGTYTVTVTDSNGCTGSDSETITEQSAFTITENITACENATVVFPDGTSTVITADITHVSNLVSSTGCDSIITTNVSMQGLNASISSYVNVSCYGLSDGQATATATGGAAPFTYLWSNGSGSPSISALSAGNYLITITDINGCSGSTNVLITEPEELTITISPYQIVCEGETALITATATGGTFPYTYQWSNGGTTSTISLLPTSNSYYYLTLTDGQGCYANAFSQVDVYPPLVLSLSSPGEEICPGESTFINIVYSGGNGGPYTISDGTGTISNPYTVYPDATTTYNITIDDNCSAPVTESIEIEVLKPPTVIFDANPLSGCVPLEVNFNSSGSDTESSYQWVFGNDEGWANTQNPTHVFDEPGVYDISLTLTSTLGCVNTYLVDDMISVYEMPDAMFMAMPPSVSIMEPEIYFNNLSSTTHGAHWYFGDGNQSNQIDPSHIYDIPGEYDVILVAINQFGCTDTTELTVYVNEENTFYAPTAITTVLIGPNSYFYPVGIGIQEEGFRMYIYDRWGEVIFFTDKYNSNFPQMYGWDGKVKGKNDAKTGTYTWLVIYRDNFGNEHERAGAVTVFR